MSRAARTATRVRQPLVRGARRLEGRTVILGIIVLAVGGFFAYVSVIAVNGVPFQDRYRVAAELPGDVPPLKVSDEVRIAGTRAGTVTGVEPKPDGVIAQLDLDPAFAPLHRDATIDVRVKLTTSLVYLNVDPGSGPELPEGGLIPAEQVVLSSTLPQAVETFDRQTRDAFGRAVAVTGFGLDGRGGDLHVALQDLRAVAEDGTPMIESLTPRRGELSGLIEGTRRTLRGLGGSEPGDLAEMLPPTRQTLDALDARRETLGRSVDRLRPVEDQSLATFDVADPLLRDLSGAVRELEPGARALRAALPDANHLMAQGDEVRSETARFTAAADPALRAAGPALASLLEPIQTVQPLGESLAPAIRTLRRSVDDIAAFGEGLVDTTTRDYQGGQASGLPAWRFSTVFTCHDERNPFPQPGTADKDAKKC